MVKYFCILLYGGTFNCYKIYIIDGQFESLKVFLFFEIYQWMLHEDKYGVYVQ